MRPMVRDTILMLLSLPRPNVTKACQGTTVRDAKMSDSLYTQDSPMPMRVRYLQFPNNNEERPALLVLVLELVI